jgi:hypothetical protein
LADANGKWHDRNQARTRHSALEDEPRLERAWPSNPSPNGIAQLRKSEAVVSTMEKLPENERRRAVIRTASGQPYDFDLIELIYDGIKKART